MKRSCFSTCSLSWLGEIELEVSLDGMVVVSLEGSRIGSLPGVEDGLGMLVKGVIWM